MPHILKSFLRQVEHEEIRLENEGAECFYCGKGVGVGIRRIASLGPFLAAETFDCWECYPRFIHEFEGVKARRGEMGDSSLRAYSEDSQ